jgi:RimJ/RimL family protein N-acetyltransferase
LVLENKNIVLRYIKESDIEDYKRWTTVETEWADWDAPWERDYMAQFVKRQEMAVKEVPAVYRKLEIDTLDGKHIGWVTSYFMRGDKEKLALGIDIPSVVERGKGYGENALTCFMAYLFAEADVLYTQT